MLLEDPFYTAAREAASLGVCPVTQLDAFYTNHTTFDELCCKFCCKACVADDEDMGLGHRDSDYEARSLPDVWEGGWEIPF